MAGAAGLEPACTCLEGRSLNPLGHAPELVVPARFELATCRLGNDRSFHLSYGTRPLPADSRRKGIFANLVAGFRSL